jgi:hypothetical protein
MTIKISAIIAEVISKGDRPITFFFSEEDSATNTYKNNENDELNNM